MKTDYWLGKSELVFPILLRASGVSMGYSNVNGVGKYMKEQEKSEMSGEEQTTRGLRNPRMIAVIVAVAGVCISLLLCQARRSWERQLLGDAFRADAANLDVVIEREVNLFLEVLDSLGRLHGISVEVDQQSFGEFVRKGLLYHKRILGVFGWAPRVPEVQREMYQQAMRRMGRAEFEIRERTGDQQLVKAARRDEYFPVSYAEPTGTGELPLGFDLTSEPANREALTLSAETGDARAGERTLLLGGEPQRYGHFVFSPIYAKTSGEASLREDLAGFVVAALELERILEKALSYPVPEGMNIRIFDGTSTSATVPLYSYVSGGELMHGGFSKGRQAADGDEEGAAGLCYRNRITAGGQCWLVLCTPTPAFMRMHRTYQPWALLVAGLVITGLITMHLLHIAGRSEKIEATVKERTAELSAANSELRRIMTERRELEQEILEISTLEKRRVGQDLHDSLGQQLTGIGFLSSALEKKLGEQSLPEKKQAAQIATFMKDSISKVRRIARGLSPVEMNAEGLADALRVLAEDTQALFDVPCRFDLEAPCLIHDNIVAINLYHIAQEAVNNAARHAHAENIEILLTANETGGELWVEDNGRGMPPDTRAGAGMGLKFMRYRAEMIDAELTLSPRPGGGTIVKCCFQNEEG